MGAISRNNASKLLLMADMFGLSALRKAVMRFIMHNNENFDAAQDSDEYDAFSADLLREFWSYAAERKPQEAKLTALPPNVQWGEMPLEFPDGMDFEKLSKGALRRACFER